ncbi:MAG: shikimate dehydrogenase [Clostridiales bacterium]|jgi:shikimate dehydrogenase|nr:shikimate dehydrogenase [Clostridiales bacterium]
MDKFYVIGDPIKHSHSPLIHNAILDFLGMGQTYTARQIGQEELACFINEVRGGDVKGFNVTAPHKIAIMQYLDEIGAEVEKIGAVNTVRSIEGRMVGYNTDADGFSQMLKRAGVRVTGAKVKIIGAGGAARGVIYALLRDGAEEITVYNRTQEKAAKLAADFGVDYELPEAFTPECDILINTSSAEMFEGGNNGIDLPEDSGFKPNVTDIIYLPPETRFLKQARERGCQTQNGLNMLIFQAIRAAEIWHGVDLMENEELLRRIHKKFAEIGVV